MGICTTKRDLSEENVYEILNEIEKLSCPSDEMLSTCQKFLEGIEQETTDSN